MTRLAIRCAFAAALCGGVVACGGDGERADGGAHLAVDDTAKSGDARFTAPLTSSYFPLAVGNSWTYRVTEIDTNATYVKVQTVESREAVGGSSPAADTTAFRLLTRKRPGAADEDRTLSWQSWAGTRLLRHREVTFAPGVATAAQAKTELFWVPARLRFDARPGGQDLGGKPKWTETFDERETDLSTGGGALTPCPPGGCTKTEAWEVLGEEDCNLAPAPVINGGTRPSLRCLRVRKQGGTESDKYYDFAPGIGKVREVGLQSMETLVEATIAGGGGT